MEACLLITKTNKSAEKKGKILFINAVEEVRQDKNIGFLEQKHIDKIFGAYQKLESQENFSALKTIEDVISNNGNMAISLYVQPKKKEGNEVLLFDESFEKWNESGNNLKSSMNELFQILES